MTAWKEFRSKNVSDIREAQARRLVRFIREQVYPYSPFYRRAFDKQGVRPEQFRSLDDLRRIPFTTKADLLPTDANPDGYRAFILQPNQELIRRHASKTRLLEFLAQRVLFGEESLKARMRAEYQPIFMSSTTGRSAEPITFLYTKHDIRRLELSGERLLEIFETGPGDRVVNLFPYAPHLAFWQTALAGLSKGVLVLSTGGGKVMGTAGNIRAIVRMKPGLIIGIPGYIYHLLRTAREEEQDFSFVKKVVLGAEKVTPGMKAKMAQLLIEMGAKAPLIFGTYGFTEARVAWGECPSAGDGSSGYHTYPDMEIIEIVNPETGEPVAEGDDGEIVYTNLDGRGSCVLRYRTGDVTRGGLLFSPCPHCGRTVPRISSDIYRISNVREINTTKIKGTLVNLNVFNEVLSSDHAIDEWQLEIHKRNDDPFDLDELVLNITLRDGIKPEAVEQNLRQQLKTATELSPNRINFLSLPDMLQRLGMESELKEKRILDLRPKN